MKLYDFLIRRRAAVNATSDHRSIFVTYSRQQLIFTLFSANHWCYELILVVVGTFTKEQQKYISVSLSQVIQLNQNLCSFSSIIRPAVKHKCYLIFSYIPLIGYLPAHWRGSKRLIQSAISGYDVTVPRYLKGLSPLIKLPWKQ